MLGLLSLSLMAAAQTGCAWSPVGGEAWDTSDSCDASAELRDGEVTVNRTIVIATPPSAPPALRLVASTVGSVARDAATADTTSIWRASDGLFYVTGRINGREVRFLVDTGASAIVLTAADAERVGADASTAQSWTADTANGRRTMRQVRLDRMAVGATEAADVPAAVAPDGLAVSLLGANWLAHIGSVTIEGDRMILR